MKTIRRQTAVIAFALATVCGLSLGASPAELSEADKQFLSAYEQVRIALADDDLVNARAEAADLGGDGAAIEWSDTLADAREAFAVVSLKAVRLAKGRPGYYVAYCAKIDKEWVQTSTKISNPYGGRDMLTCGEIRK